jgi:hypothetical protein
VPGSAFDHVDEIVVTARSEPAFVGARWVKDTHKRVLVARCIKPRTGSPLLVSDEGNPKVITFFEVVVESNPVPFMVILKVSELRADSMTVTSGVTALKRHTIASDGDVISAQVGDECENSSPGVHVPPAAVHAVSVEN